MNDDFGGINNIIVDDTGRKHPEKSLEARYRHG